MNRDPDDYTDETPLCPALVESLTNAQTVSEVRRLMAEHERDCAVCNPVRKAA